MGEKSKNRRLLLSVYWLVEIFGELAMNMCFPTVPFLMFPESSFPFKLFHVMLMLMRSSARSHGSDDGEGRRSAKRFACSLGSADRANRRQWRLLNASLEPLLSPATFASLSPGKQAEKRKPKRNMVRQSGLLSCFYPVPATRHVQVLASTTTTSLAREVGSVSFMKF